MSNKVRIGFVGVGNMGKPPICATIPWFPIAKSWLLGCQTGSCPNWSLPNGVCPPITRHTPALLANEQLDAIIAIQPFTRHGTLIPELLASGKPVLTEKPIAGSIAQAQRVIAAMATHNTWMMVGYHKRSDPATMLAKAEIEKLQASGELGKLTYIRILMPAGDWIANGFNQNLWNTQAQSRLHLGSSRCRHGQCHQRSLFRLSTTTSTKST
jgi:hypothetical protein